MVYVFFIAISILFIECFVFFKITHHVSSMMDIVKEAANVFLSSADDNKKEEIIKRSSVKLFIETFYLIIRFLLISIFIFGLYYLIITISPQDKTEIINGLSSYTILAGLTIFSFIYISIRNVIKKIL